MDNLESSPATRADFRRLDGKIDAATARLVKEIVAMRADLREIKEVMATKSDIQRVLDSIDSFAGKSVN